jgi:hypothetical protein
MRKLLAAAFLAISLAPAFAQAPPPVPALPDTERRTAYVLSSQTGPLSVGFAIYGDSTDFVDWIHVWVNGVQVTTGWTLTSPTGALASIPRPITNAQITFAVAQTGTVQIVGARRPRRLSQFSENRGVAARDLNVVITDLVAQNREQWDLLENRVLQGIPGEVLSPLPPAATRASKLLGFDGNGNTAVYDLGTGGGGGGSGVSVLNCTSPIVCTPSPITSVGTASLAASGVVAGSYGSSSQIPVITVDAFGRITSATSVAGSQAWANITGTPTTLAGYGIQSPLRVIEGGTGGQNFTANAPILGNGTNSFISGSRRGTTTVFTTASGSFTSGNCLQADVNSNIVDAATPCSGGYQVTSVIAFGAVGDCVANDTTAFQNAVTAAAAAGGSGVVYVPPVAAGKCYRVGAINATKKDGITVRGNGDQSLIKPIGFSTTNHIWWDLSGAKNVRFENFKVEYDGATIPDILFLTAGVSGYAGDVVSGIHFNGVNIDAQSAKAHLYAYGVSWSGSGSMGAGGMSCTNSTWYQRKNGLAAANPSLRTAVMVLNGINTWAIASDYQTLTVANPGNNSILLNNCNFIDFPAGFGAGFISNNAGFIAVTTGVLTSNGGSIQCVCDTDAVYYTNNEGFNYNGTAFLPSDGTGTTVHYWQRFGGGTNGSFTFNAVFWSVPTVNFIGWDPAVAGEGGIHHLNILSPDIGGNTGLVFFMQTTFACAAPAATTWIAISKLELPNGANNIQVCGDIDSHTLIQNPGTVALPGGATDNSHHF